MILVNAQGLVMGRLASFAAKKAIEGNSVTIVNAEKAIITGNKQPALKKMQTRLNLHNKGNPEKGPKFSKMPDKVLRMAIRGMLPWKSSRGKQAFKRIHTYIGIPAELEGKKFEELPKAKAKKEEKAVSLGEVSKLLGAKW